MTEDPVRGHFVERAKEDLGGHRSADIRPELTAGLSLADHVPDDAQVLSKLGRREPLHEFRRLTQLDLKDDGEVAVTPQPPEV